MPNPTVVGLFDTAGDAERARDELVEAGVARHRIIVTRLAEDAASADAGDARYSDEPASETGADYDWLGSFVGHYPDPDKLGEAARAGACLVAVAARSHVDKKAIADLMRRYGARGTVEREP